MSSALFIVACPTAIAQQLSPPDGYAPASTPESAAQSQGGSAPVGTIAQPSVDNPGWVAGVTVGELYTDNLRLAASGRSKQASWITQVEPFLRAAYSGKRLSGVIDYTLTGYLYEGQHHGKQLTHNLDAQGSVTVLPDHFFISGSAVYGSQIISNETSAVPGTYFLSNNRANVARGTLSPYWVQDVADVGTATLRYSYGRVVYNTNGIPSQKQSENVLAGVPDVSSHTLQFGFSSPKDRSVGWNLRYSDQRIEPDYGRGLEYAIAQAGGYVELNYSLRLLADAGRESQFFPDGSVDKLGASFWDVGVSWADALNSLEAKFGHRFYGRSYQFSWRHTAARLNTTVSYVEQPTDINQQLLGQNPGDIVSTPVNGSIIPSLSQRQAYLMKRATVSAEYDMPDSKLRVAMYDERRTFFAPGTRGERVRNANVDWRFEVGAFTTLTPTLGWQRYKFRDGQDRDNLYEELALVHQFSAKDFASVKFRHDTSDVSSALPGAHGYNVNVIFLQWTHLL
ncbi:TIGR03016 family PEP-CTERM system-associated outer membrane protein [Oleiagrimonas sp. C23AA]|nr:TIGR03016 family PEP-CTERM system-associated outer membrane protein [Oleiagrimonas sp. C23AA]